jgi:anti-sigma factor RsiW
MTELSDELLVAYVDGQLARKQALAVDKVLEQDDVIARRVKALKHAHDRLEAAFDAILAGEEADVAPKPLPRPPGLFIPWTTLANGGLAAAGIAVAFGLAVAGFGWPLTVAGDSHKVAADPEYVGSVPRSWQEDVARAQGLLGRDSLEIGLESQGNPDLVAFKLTQAIGTDMAPPNLMPEGYRFMRAQFLRTGNESLAQLLYLGTKGAPLALYVKKGEGTSPPSFKRYDDVGSVSWSQGGVTYMLAGDGDETALRRLAEIVSKEIVAPVTPPAASSPAAASTPAAPAQAGKPPPLPKQKPKS